MTLTVEIQGIVEVRDGFPIEKREQLAVVNGLGLLYAAVREMVLNVTARSANGAFCLPVLSFVDAIAEKIAFEKAQRESSTPVSESK